MLHLDFVFDDAIRALTEHADRLAIAPLPATVYLMQMDVINHYRHALDHYLTLLLNAPFLQNSSLGTSCQKWDHFTNEDFALLSFSVHNLLRYTSRLIHLKVLQAAPATCPYPNLIVIIGPTDNNTHHAQLRYLFPRPHLRHHIAR